MLRALTSTEKRLVAYTQECRSARRNPMSRLAVRCGQCNKHVTHSTKPVAYGNLIYCNSLCYDVWVALHDTILGEPLMGEVDK